MSGAPTSFSPDRIGEVTFRGPPVDDPETLLRTPASIRSLLSEYNGFILFHGGLDVRGACKAPDWHSLGAAWDGEKAFHRLYTSVETADVPFAQDCMGDQFLLRGNGVLRLSAETDEIEDLGITVGGFFNEVGRDPDDFLAFDRKRRLKPGQLIQAYPPFCMAESGANATLRAISAADVIAFHADLARQIRDLPDGAKVDIRIGD